ncbi:MAG: uracil phosphoribosyltransferase [Mycoplasmatales bacterium]
MINIVKHPIITHKVSLLRRKETTTSEFRQLVKEISTLMVYEMTRDLKLKNKEIETPIAKTSQPFIDGKKLVLVPILRAGLGMVDGILDLIPVARVGHIGLYRDEETLQAVEYFVKLPDKLEERDVLLLDPMLATGSSASLAIDLLKSKGVKSIKLTCLLASKQGLEFLKSKHPDIDIYVAAVDEELNDKGYITPGLGDAGDRLFGTK